jgi:hypothetical protein
MTPKEWVIKNYGEKWLDRSFCWESGDVIDAMEEYGKQQWNEAIDACILKGKNGFYTTKDGSISERILIDIEELKKLKK